MLPPPDGGHAQHEADGDRERLRSGLLEAVVPLIARPDLLQLGVKREANHITNSKHLYYDGQMSVTLDRIPERQDRSRRTTTASGKRSSSAPAG